MAVEKVKGIVFEGVSHINADKRGVRILCQLMWMSDDKRKIEDSAFAHSSLLASNLSLLQSPKHCNNVKSTFQQLLFYKPEARTLQNRKVATLQQVTHDPQLVAPTVSPTSPPPPQAAATGQSPNR